ncbi:unnamed protein product [Staurois parvus]|uniref:Uncharacterized protein n=1 Tax=Staurois parvus TaxID=386267 RepID=A0ABN9HAQ7_9NEOB|nr:unnamed protein product [Staurois parvus]
MKSPIRGPCFENPQHSDCTGVCRPFYRVLTIVLGSTPAVRSQAGSTPADRRFHPGRREVSALESGGSQTSGVC